MAVRDRRVNAMEIDFGLVNANGGVPERGNLHLAGNSTFGGFGPTHEPQEAQHAVYQKCRSIRSNSK